MVDYMFIPGDTDDGTKAVQELKMQAKDEKRPHLVADVGAPYGIVRIVFPPKGTEDQQYTYNQLIQLLRDRQLVPVQMGMDWRFLSWKEMRLLFESLLDRHLYDNYNIVPTDRVEEDGDNKSE